MTSLIDAPLIVKVILALLMTALPTSAGPQSSDQLREGHWVKVKGTLGKGRAFVASSLEVLEPERKSTLIGTASDVDVAGQRFLVLNQPVHVSDKTKWKDLTMRSIKGRRIKIEGYYRGPRNFSARTIRPYGKGRARLVGRIDSLRVVGDERIAQVMGYEVSLPQNFELVNKKPLDKIALAPARTLNADQVRQLDEDDFIPGSIRINDAFSFGALLELKLAREDNYNLNDDRARDEAKSRGSISAQLAWRPNEDFFAIARGRFQARHDDEEESSPVDDLEPRLSELFAAWRSLFVTGLELQVGRQDFDDQREWVYDENLDAVRLAWSTPRFRAELSASTLVEGGSTRNENTDNLILYLSNNDRKRTLAAYVVDRRDDRGAKDYPLHFGAGAYGKWFPNNKMWAEASLLRGYTGNVDLDSYGFDVGTTWSPEFAEPLNFTIGYAFGSGDPDPADGVDRTFRQTGLQDNNDRFGGVTSFRYYGEIFDPELSNLSIMTLGVGARLTRKTSLDLVLHKYTQDEAATTLRNTNLRRQPDGVHSDLGWEADMILGTRAWDGWDFELVFGMFHAGDAFPGADDALHGAFQIRYRF